MPTPTAFARESRGYIHVTIVPPRRIGKESYLWTRLQELRRKAKGTSKKYLQGSGISIRLLSCISSFDARAAAREHPKSQISAARLALRPNILDLL